MGIETDKVKGVLDQFEWADPDDDDELWSEAFSILLEDACDATV